MNKFPLYSADLVAEIVKDYPVQVIGPDTPLNQIMFNAGVQSVVANLLAAKAEAEKQARRNAAGPLADDPDDDRDPLELD